MCVNDVHEPVASGNEAGVLVALRSPSDFLRLYSERNHDLFAPECVDVEVGTVVDIEIAFSEPALTFSTRGVVRWRRTHASRGLVAGSGLDFLSTEMGTRDLLLRFARGLSIPDLHHRARRFRASVEMEVLVGGARRRIFTDNISHTGAFLRTEALQGGGAVPVRIFGREHSVDLDAEVRWIRSDATRGVGVRFVFADAATRTSVRSLLREYRSSI